SSNIAVGSTRAAQLRLARRRPESLFRPCVRLRPPVWRRPTKNRPLAVRSNGRTRNRAVTVMGRAFRVRFVVFANGTASEHRETYPGGGDYDSWATLGRVRDTAAACKRSKPYLPVSQVR